MKKASIVLSVLFVMAMAFSSCRTQKKACAAYSSVEQPQQVKDIPG